jgi:hypothetical protein
VQADVRLYPNPTKGNIYLRTTNDVQSINVFDMTGKLVRSVFQQKSINIETLVPHKCI